MYIHLMILVVCMHTLCQTLLNVCIPLSLDCQGDLGDIGPLGPIGDSGPKVMVKNSFM